MATETDNFGAGIFDDGKETESPKDEVASTESEAVVLTDREIAIAKGEDPDNPPEVESSIDTEPEAEQEQEVVEEPQEEAEEVANEQEEDSKHVFSLGDKRLAARYGLTDDDLEKFGSSEALHHALDLFDKAGTSLNKSSEKESTESPAEVSAEDAAAGDEGGALSDSVLGFEKLDVSKYEKADDPYDKDTIELVKHVRKTQDMLERIVNASQTQASNANADKFHDMLDAHPDIYGATMQDGKPVKIDGKYESARQAVKDQAETIYAGIVARKGNIPPVEKIIEQAMMAVHGKDLTSKGKVTDRAEKLKKQSSKKRSVGSSATTRKRNQAESDPTDAKSIARHPDIEAFFRKAQEENGAV